jgi:hypothetical protein
MIALRFAAWWERNPTAVWAVAALALTVLVDLAIALGAGR